jgi:hypothetical protein
MNMTFGLTTEVVDVANGAVASATDAASAGKFAGSAMQPAMATQSSLRRILAKSLE